MISDTAAPQRKRTRRGRSRPPGPSRNPCGREGCPKSANAGYQHCCFVCTAIAQELERVQRVCQVLGPGTPLVSELWTETVALSDGWTRCLELERNLFDAARSVGVTGKQWQAIKAGR